MGEEQNREWLEKTLEELESKVEGLRVEAKRVIDEYWAFHLTQNEKMALKERSVLGTRVKVTDGNMAIEWYRNQYVPKKGGGWQPLSKYIRRGKGNRYATRTLAAWAKDWELSLVLETEDRLAEIREQYACLSKTRFYLRKWLKILDKQDSEAAEALAANAS